MSVKKKFKKQFKPVNKKKKFQPKPKKFTSPTKYLKQVGLELKKVAWPSRQEVILSTIIVIIMVIIFAVITGLLDLGFSGLLKVVSTNLGKAALK